MAVVDAVKVEVVVTSWADVDTLILGFLHRKFKRATGQINSAGSCRTNLKGGSEWTATMLLSYFQDNLEPLWAICALKPMVEDCSQLHWVPCFRDREGNNCGTLPRKGSKVQFPRTGTGEHPGSFKHSSKSFFEKVTITGTFYYVDLLTG